MTRPIIRLLPALSLFFSSCSLLAAPQASDIHLTELVNPLLNPSESFTADDAPDAFTHETRDFTGPWGYGKEENNTRLYPLVVSGRWDEGSAQYAHVNQTYPAFVISYQEGTDAAGRTLGEWIKSAIDAGYRIDINRIYLTGFSWGGSGSYPLARGMYDAGLYFAAIMRVAGQSEPDLTNDIAMQTAVWYHIGLNDTTERVNVAREAMAKMRGYACNSDAGESSRSDSQTGYGRTTVTLTRKGIPMFKYSEYTGMGHTSGPCYKDGSVFPWMFCQSLEYR